MQSMDESTYNLVEGLQNIIANAQEALTALEDEHEGLLRECVKNVWREGNAAYELVTTW
jgi:hypothetical protein